MTLFIDLCLSPMIKDCGVKVRRFIYTSLEKAINYQIKLKSEFP